MTDATQAREQAHLDQVIDRIKAAEQEASQKIQSAKKDIDTISGDFNEIRMNTTTYSGMMDTAMSVRAQQQLLDERENSWQHAADRLGTFRRLEAKPYFARIDFTEEAGQTPETIYIGLASFADSPDHFLGVRLAGADLFNLLRGRTGRGFLRHPRWPTDRQCEVKAPVPN